MADSARTLTDLFGLLGTRRTASAEPAAVSPVMAVAVTDASHATKALPKFLACLQAREHPLVMDLGPVVGSNVTFFGEQLGCRIRVEDVAADIEDHLARSTTEALPALLRRRFTEAPGSVDGILCWDVFDYLDRPSADALAGALVDRLRPGGVLLGFFNTSAPRESVYTKYIVVDPQNLRYKTYAATRARQRPLLTGDVIRLFKGLRVADSFLMKSQVREMLFRKDPA